MENSNSDLVENHGYNFYRKVLKSPKYVVAPMVEQSELPWRMLSRKYNSDLCYTPMMHAGVFVRDPTYRAENFITCAEDRPLIAQFCTDDPDLFVKAAKMIENECDGIDLNLGCPQNIAKRGHYGSFLQDEWDLIYKILKKGCENIKIPVTAKIRIFETIEKSVEYAKMIESTGVALIAVHGRLREQKGPNTGLASWPHIAAIKKAVKIPVFANGNILSFNDVIRCMNETGCDGVMIAEPNLYNPALFSNLNPISWEIAEEYIQFVEKYPTNFASIRGHLFKIFHKVFETHVDLRERMAKIKDINILYDFFKEIKQICENKPDESNKEIKYWHCQPYIRSLPNSNASLNIEESVKLSESVDQTNIKCESEIIDPEVARKLSKIIERKKRKQERIDRKLKYNDLGNKQKKTKYVNCENCKNPRGETCSFNLCRKCCKDKVWNEQKECKGHGLKFRIKSEQNDNFDSSQSISSSSHLII